MNKFAHIPFVNLVDASGFIIRGGHRASLGRLARDGSLTHRQCSDEMRQNYIDMAMLEPPLVDVDGDVIFITDAGRKALTGYQVGDESQVLNQRVTH